MVRITLFRRKCRQCTDESQIKPCLCFLYYCTAGTMIPGIIMIMVCVENYTGSVLLHAIMAEFWPNVLDVGTIMI